MTHHRPLHTPQDVCEADLTTLSIVTAIQDFTGDMANIYAVSNRPDTDEDVYIGELCDPRLLTIIRAAPKLAEFLQFLKGTAVLDPDEDAEWIEFVEQLHDELGL